MYRVSFYFKARELDNSLYFSHAEACDAITLWNDRGDDFWACAIEE
jgi:hypothetical protein